MGRSAFAIRVIRRVRTARALIEMRTIRGTMAFGSARSGEWPGPDRHEPIHGGFGKNILFLTISKTPFPTRRRATQSVRLLRS